MKIRKKERKKESVSIYLSIFLIMFLSTPFYSYRHFFFLLLDVHIFLSVNLII